MRLSYSKFCVTVLLLVGLTLTSLAVFNYLRDPHGIYNTKFSRPVGIAPNQRFIKMKYLIEHPARYDSFIFGSSRVGNIHIDEHPTLGRYYNMTYSEGVPEEYLHDIRLLLKNGVRIQTLVIGLDDFSFRVDPKNHRKQLARYPYSENNLHYYFEYLLRIPDSQIIMLERSTNEQVHYDFFSSGSPRFPDVDRKIEADTAAHIADPKFERSSAYLGNRTVETLNEISEIIAIAQKNGIRLIFFINPIHHTTYLTNNLEEFAIFKSELAKLTAYVDFSGINSITKNNYYYYETSHYRPIVGDMIISRLFGDGAQAPADFGSMVYRN